jgi:hypothetical protein
MMGPMDPTRDPMMDTSSMKGTTSIQSPEARSVCD